MTKQALRSAIRREQRDQSGNAVRYPDEVRQAVASFVRSERSRGISLSALAGTLELPINTLRRWCEKHEGESRLTPVEVVAGDPPDGAVLVTPSGHRVEGLSLATLVTLLEHLG